VKSHHKRRAATVPGPAFSSGFTLVGLLISMMISLFLLGGLVSVLQGTRRTSSNQVALAQLQNNERVALSMMTDIIQQAGYYPNVQTSELQTAFPVAPAVSTAPAFSQPGQIISGISNATAGGDSVTVRYQTDGSVMNCLGQSSGSVDVAHEYTFSVSSSAQLACSVDGAAPVPLVGNVQHMQILYGVDALASSPFAGSAVNAYVAASQMSPVNWTNVYSVKIILTFTNPLAGQPGQAAAPPITFTRIVGVMSRTGVNTVTEIS
jgi:type IV pilus assembly protein PilW